VFLLSFFIVDILLLLAKQQQQKSVNLYTIAVCYAWALIEDICLAIAIAIQTNTHAFIYIDYSQAITSCHEYGAAVDFGSFP
jgi:hypothetical protein